MAVHYSPGGLKAKGAGACFPDRPYFPVILANGVDAVTIGPVGTALSRHDISSMTLPNASSLGWFKTDRKHFASDTSYGSSLCLADPRTFLFLGDEQFMPLKTDQVFDPRTATVTTTFGLFSNRDTGSVRVEVKTFLTDDHLLVERFRILEAPAMPVHLEFSLAMPFDSGSCDMDPPVQARSIRSAPLKRAGGLQYSYRLCGYQGIGATWHDGAAPVIKTVGKNGSRRVVSAVLQAGASLTHYVAVLDNKDAGDPRRALAALVNKVRAEGYTGIYREHVANWRAYFRRSSVRLPARDLRHLYDTSLYVLRSVQDRRTGFMPMGIVPFHFQNAMFWDSWFASMAWLGCNRQAEARGMSAFWKRRLPEARAVARQLKCGGARFAWTSNREHFCRDKATVVQFHNNAVVALQVAQVWRATGDANFLREHLPVMEEALQFLFDRLVRVQGGDVALLACAGPDESVLDQKRMDTWTCAVIIKTIDEYLAAIRTLGCPPFQNILPRLRRMLWTALNRNVDRRGVLQSFEGGAHPHWGSLIFTLFPEHPARRRTLRALSMYDRELDGYNSHGIIHYPERVFTWTEYWVARIQAEAGERTAWERLQKNVKFTNMFGGMPERIYMHGELFKNWFMTSHAACLWAVHALLLHRDGDNLRVLTGLPEDWKTAAFDNLTTADGLRVSAAMKNGRLTRLEIINDHAEARRIRLHAPGIKAPPFMLASGRRWRRPSGVGFRS